MQPSSPGQILNTHRHKYSFLKPATFFFRSRKIQHPESEGWCCLCFAWVSGGSQVQFSTQSMELFCCCAAVGYQTWHSALLCLEKRRRADLIRSAFLSSDLGKHLKTPSCHPGELSLFDFHEDAALRWVKYNQAGFCIPELALAMLKLPLANYLCGEIESYEHCSSLYDRKLFVSPLVTTHKRALAAVEMEIQKPLLKVKKSSSSSGASAWKHIYFDREKYW